MAESFFEFHQRVTRRPNSKAPPGQGDPLTVTQLTTMVDKAIKAGVPASVIVRGEVSNASSRQSSGHLYFTMKDSGACVNCVMWRESAARLQFKLEDGLDVVATGRIGIYAPQGRYQLYVDRLEPAGRGALELAFRQMQAKLAAEGLFEAERKRPIPRFPSRIVMVTSRDTAALQDMLKVLRRFSWLTLMLYHVPVQGRGSAEKIAEAIGHLSRRADDIGGVDVILLARGGGSLEDLWSFNEETVARAIAASSIPIVTGIGHEIDCTIADLVADYHAHTPTESAQVITQHWKLASDALLQSRFRLTRAVRQMILEAAQRLAAIQRHEIFRRPMDRIHVLGQLLDDRQKSISLALHSRLRHATQNLGALEPRLYMTARGYLKLHAARLDALDRQLQALSPKAVLGRGYTITMLKKSGQILRSSKALTPGDRLLTRFADGQAESTVQDSRQLPLFE